MGETGLADEADEAIPLRVQGAVYASGYLATGMQNMTSLIIPLWVVVTLDPSAFMIGVILGARPLLPALLSIHGGAMMDRLGARQVMMVFAAVGIVVPLLYPLAPWVAVVVVLQMLGGLATTMSWIGAQTLIGQVMKGSPTHSGRLGSAALFGNLTVPPIIGAAWDLFGPWGAFATMSLWAAGLLVAAAMLPAPPQAEARTGGAMRLRDFVPRLASYIEAFALLSVPAILAVVLVSVLRNNTYAVRGSFYVVHLDGIGITGTEIGLLMSAAGLVGAGAALTVGRLSKMFAPIVLLFVTVAAAIVFISVTPLLGAFWQLAIVAGLWGGSVGMSMPLMFSILSRAADPRSQGKSVGVRITANRLSAAILPVVMGAVAEAVGVGASFLIIGGAMLAALAGVALYCRRIIGP